MFGLIGLSMKGAIIVADISLQGLFFGKPWMEYRG